MWEKMNDILREKFVITDEKLLGYRKRTNESVALIFLAVCSVALGIGNQLVMGIMYESASTQLLVSAVLCVLGVLFLVGGVAIGRTKEKECVAEYWGKNCGYTVEEIKDYVRECRQESSFIYHSDIWDFVAPKSLEKIGKDKAHEMGFLTRHWLGTSKRVNIVKIEDIAAIWYEPHPKDRDTYPGVFFVSVNGWIGYEACREKVSNWLIGEILKRNPMAIASKKFVYEGITYDSAGEPERVIALYREEKKRQGIGGKE